MPRIFISHSSRDNALAIAFKQWLSRNDWPSEDVFLDVDDIGAGERWKEALRKANARCEAVILLASPEALSSPECLAEIRKAEDYGKEIIVVLVRDVRLDDSRLGSLRERQIVDLSALPQAYTETISYRGEQQEVRFNKEALARIKDYLIRRGIAPDHFAWPPEDKLDAPPFPGLAAFTEDDAGIFFGRDLDILRALDKLRVLRRDGRPRFLIVHGASGAGKSSFLRAGLWARLKRDPDFVPLAILRAANGILTGPAGLGRALSRHLSRPGFPALPGNIHAALLASSENAATKSFIRLMQKAAAQARIIRRIGDKVARAPAIILAVDQAEELFEPENAAESERFLLLLADLLHNPPIGVELFVLLTIRAESLEQLSQSFSQRRMEAAETLVLPALPPTSYREIILRPIEVLARRGQRLAIEPALTEQLIKDTTGADALPLLAFTLSQLYQDYHAGGQIALSHDVAMGGVAGAIDKAIASARAKPGDEPVIPVGEKAQLDLLRAAFIPWLARIEPQSGAWTRRLARFEEIPERSRNIVKRLTGARLLVTDRRSGVDVVEIAHESLLRQWPPLRSWLEAETDSLKLIEDIERSASLWENNDRQKAWLDHRDERLSASDQLAARADFKQRLGPLSTDYLAACHTAERLMRRRKRNAQVLVGVLIIALIGGLTTWWQGPRLKEWAYGVIYARGQTLNAEREHQLAEGDGFRECTHCPDMVAIPADTFTMGSVDDSHEKPPHTVTIRRPFAVAKFELTFDQWDACVRYGDCNPNISASRWGRGVQPVINVTWADAQRYVKWLSRITNKPYRFLTEAEWEYAARAKSQAHFAFGPDEADLAKYAWYEANSSEGDAAGEKGPHSVGTREPNIFGLYDMHGNVSEWVEDCYQNDYQGAPADGSAWIPGNCSRRVVRGGSWIDRARALRSAARDWSIIDKGERDKIGVRVGRSLP